MSDELCTLHCADLALGYDQRMKAIADPRLKTDETDGPVERGYGAWTRAKIERGLAQAQERGAMIPVEQPLAALKLEY
ncbi:hypothetical protein [Sphingomonas sp. 28-63-12]|uniref:hypothetical protein n=1 Tax=Sphingomonas sp. 28-63-12 TaxID=1970434 RepID=UPI0035A8B6EA